MNVATVNSIDAVFDAMMLKKSIKRSEVPKYMPKSMSILYYHDLMVEYLSKVCGARGIPPHYVHKEGGSSDTRSITFDP